MLGTEVIREEMMQRAKMQLGHVPLQSEREQESEREESERVESEREESGRERADTDHQQTRRDTGRVSSRVPSYLRGQTGDDALSLPHTPEARDRHAWSEGGQLAGNDHTASGAEVTKHGGGGGGSGGGGGGVAAGEHRVHDAERERVQGREGQERDEGETDAGQDSPPPSPPP